MDKPEVAQEAEWIRRSQRGDRDAFGLLSEKYRRRVFSLVFHIIQRREPVEDLSQEILVKAFVGIRSYNFQASFGAWLSQIGVNHCYDYLRKERASRVSYFGSLTEERERELEARLESPEPGGLRVDERAALRDLVEKLLRRAPAQDRILLTLKELEELSVEQMAEILGLKPGTVKVRLHRARRRMLEDLNHWRQGG